jgi:hypothetical protein
MLNLGRTGPHSPEQPLAETAAPDGRGERRQRQLLKVMNRRNRPRAVADAFRHRSLKVLEVAVH